MKFFDLSAAHTAWLGDALLQVSALLAVALVASRLLRRTPAAWRHALLLGAACGVPLLFIFSAALPSWKLPLSEPLSATFEPKPIQIESSILYEVGAPLANTAPPAVPPSPSLPVVQEVDAKPASTASWWLMVWLAGTIGLWLRMARGIFALSRHRANGDRRLSEIIAAEAQQLGLASPPKLTLLDKDAMPMTWRLRRHTIALPSCAKDWSSDKLRRVVRHELAHARRNDCHTAWLATAALALIWFHPLSWLLRRALDRTREAACDDLALRAARADDQPNAYAQDLLDIVTKHSRSRRGAGLALALAMANRRTGMQRRLESILDATRDRRPVPPHARRWMAPLWLLGIASLATIAACRMEAPETSAPTVEASGDIITKEYRLVEHQQRFLGILATASREIIDDPFASSGESIDQESWIEGPEGASAARNALRNYGIEIPSDSPVRFNLSDRYTLEVKADADTHAKIKEALDGDVSRRQVKLQLHIFEIDDLDWLSEFVTVDDGPQTTGLLTSEQREQLIEKLKAKSKDKGAFRSTPSLVTRFGQRAKFESIRELIYPTEYDPPELPANWDQPNDGDAKIYYGGFPVTPANPTAFEMRPVGTTFEIDTAPKIGDAIELKLGIEDTRFLGFLNYGAPIQTMGRNILGKPVPVVLTENRIEQPVFRTHKMDVTVEIPPGRALVLAGLRGTKSEKLADALQAPDGGNSAVMTPLRDGTPTTASEDESKGVLYIVEPTLIEAE